MTTILNPFENFREQLKDVLPEIYWESFEYLQIEVWRISEISYEFDLEVRYGKISYGVKVEIPRRYRDKLRTHLKVMFKESCIKPFKHKGKTFTMKGKKLFHNYLFFVNNKGEFGNFHDMRMKLGT